MFNKTKTYVVFIIILIAFIFTGWWYANFLISTSDAFKVKYYQKQARQMRKNTANLISQQQMLTMLIAQTLSSSNQLGQDLLHNKLRSSNSHDYFKRLASKIDTDTLYKNLWIQIVNKNLDSVYRSWSHKTGDNLSKLQPELDFVKRYKRKINSISIGHYTISIKAVSPIFYHHKFIGAVEVISHFSPIVKQLDSSQISSITLGKKSHKHQLEDLPAKKYIRKYFIADDNSSHKIIKYLEIHGVKKYCAAPYNVDLKNNRLIVCYKLRNINHQTIGYFIMFDKISHDTDMNVKYFTFKWMVINIIAIISLLLLLSIKLFISNKKQKMYYQNIIDLTNNIIIITDKKHIIQTNKIFYKYFNPKTKLKDICLTNYFLPKQDYIQQYMNGKLWIDYITLHPGKKHKVNIKIDKDIYYFTVSVSKISNDNNFCVVLTDITKEEIYQKKLEHLTITDTLTNIHNRYYFNITINHELQKIKRYNYPLSLIMFDIDFFKKINDTYGHDTGDKVLIAYTKLISSMLRSDDTFCRVGGEEFIIIATYTNLENAIVLAEKMRQRVQNFKEITAVTMSFGVVQYENKEDVEHLLKRVDNALYKAKENGRNRVEKG